MEQGSFRIGIALLLYSDLGRGDAGGAGVGRLLADLQMTMLRAPTLRIKADIYNAKARITVNSDSILPLIFHLSEWSHYTP
jgi:hypothetical protein